MPVQHDDDTLMKRLRDGDLEALGALIDRHRNAAIRHGTRCVGDFHVAEELAQEAFLRLVRCAGEYVPGGRFVPFLYRILTRLCIDELRRRQQRKRLAARLGESVDEVVDPRAFPPDRQAAGREEVQRVWSEVDGLTPDQKACLLLRELEAKSYAEIAEILGCSLESVKVTLHRARKRLLEALSRPARRSLEAKPV